MSATIGMWGRSGRRKRSDLDLVVASFGWREVGSTLFLENRTTDWSSPVFVPREIDWRQCSIHVPVAAQASMTASRLNNPVSHWPEPPARIPNRHVPGATSTVNGGAANRTTSAQRQTHFFGQP